ncbi:hypothetical protein C8R43DRAFT_960213 [Mycena crocata]|nr:hypothetical protein C8R43DRAFT_960213 [Mycena crocata]
MALGKAVSAASSHSRFYTRLTEAADSGPQGCLVMTAKHGCVHLRASGGHCLCFLTGWVLASLHGVCTMGGGEGFSLKVRGDGLCGPHEVVHGAFAHLISGLLDLVDVPGHTLAILTLLRLPALLHIAECHPGTSEGTEMMFHGGRWRARTRSQSTSMGPQLAGAEFSSWYKRIELQASRCRAEEVEAEWSATHQVLSPQTRTNIELRVAPQTTDHRPEIGDLQFEVVEDLREVFGGGILKNPPCALHDAQQLKQSCQETIVSFTPQRLDCWWKTTGGRRLSEWEVGSHPIQACKIFHRKDHWTHRECTKVLVDVFAPQIECMTDTYLDWTLTVAEEGLGANYPPPEGSEVQETRDMPVFNIGVLDGFHHYQGDVFVVSAIAPVAAYDPHHHPRVGVFDLYLDIHVRVNIMLVHRVEGETPIPLPFLLAINSNNSLRWFAACKWYEVKENETTCSGSEEEDKGSGCMERWRNMRVWGMYDKTGFFPALYRHGFVLVVVDMVKSREFATPTEERHGAGGFRVVRELFPPNPMLAVTTQYAMRFHQQQAITMYLKHSDTINMYHGLTVIITNMYRWALKIRATLPELQATMSTLSICLRVVFKEWLEKEKAHLHSLSKEPLQERLEIEYYQSYRIWKSRKAILGVGRLYSARQKLQCSGARDPGN